MLRATQEQAEQLSRLIHTQVHVYIKTCIEERRDLLEKCSNDIVIMRTVQGEIKALRTLLNLIETNGKQVY